MRTGQQLRGYLEVVEIDPHNGSSNTFQAPPVPVTYLNMLAPNDWFKNDRGRQGYLHIRRPLLRGRCSE